MKRLFFILLAFPLLVGFPDVEGPTDKGTKAYDAGKFDDALSEYQKAVDDAPEAAVPHYNLGNAYYKKGEYEKAMTEYKRAAALDPKMPEALYNAGDALYRLGRYEDALKAYQAADAGKKGDKDTEHNIEITLKRVKQEKEKQQKQPPQTNKGQGQGKKKQDKPGNGNPQKQDAGNKGQGPQSNQPQQGNQQNGPQMSNEEVQALLDRQAKEEKNLRNYFRPGDKAGDGGREQQIEQMLRGFGLSARPVRPGQPYVEKDW